MIGLAPNLQKLHLVVEARTQRIEEHMHFGDAKYLGEGLSELRWKNGLRIYFARVGNELIVFLNGEYKNDQSKDIKKARLLLERYTSA